MKICAIGNSFLGAYKQGWNKIRHDYQDVAIDFFGAIGQRLIHARSENRTLILEDDQPAAPFDFLSGRDHPVHVDWYDHILIVGTGLSLFWIIDLYRSFRSDEHQIASEYLLSPAAFQAAAFDALNRTAALHLWRLLQDLKVENVTLCPNPLPGEGLRGVPAEFRTAEMIANGDMANIVELFDAYLAQLASAGAYIRPQPSSTLCKTMFSKDCYSQGYPDIYDDVHKNEAFGIVVMEDVLAHLRDVHESPAAPQWRARIVAS